MSDKVRVVVIGSNSFSGSDFIDLLLGSGEYEITGISRSSEKSELFLPYKKNDNLQSFTFRRLDLNKDMKEIVELIAVFRPSYIVNFAAQSEVLPSWSAPEQWFQTNVIAMTNLVRSLKDFDFLKNYVHISSPEVYGSCSGKVYENARLNPSTPYAASKAAGDLSLMTFFKNFGFPLTMVRSTNVYGAHQQLFKIIPRSVIRIKMGEKIQLHGGGRAVKSYIHIRDISRGEERIMMRGRIGRTYHLSPCHGVSVRNVVKFLCDRMGMFFEEFTETVGERQGQDSVYEIDSTLARSEFDWRPEISLETGLTKVISWIEDNWDDIARQPLEYEHRP